MQEKNLSEKRPMLYGRRKGRRLRVGKAALMETLLPSLLLPKEGLINLAELFKGQKEYWLEIGFGGGEHLAHQARENPAVGLIGCEPFINGVASALEHIEKNKLSNVRLYNDDARHVLDRLPENSFDKIFLLFPDPWPKKRHADRRFIGPANLPKLARIMKKGAELRLASDDPTMQEWFLEHILANNTLGPAPGTDGGLWSVKPGNWMATRYEQKNLAKKREGWVGPRYYSFVRV